MASPTKQQQQQQQKQQRALDKANAIRRTGTLIPPSFGLTGTPSQKGTGPGLSVHRRLLSSSSNSNANASHNKTTGNDNSVATRPRHSNSATAAAAPVSYLRYLHETDLSTCLLLDHCVPGVLFAAIQPNQETMIRLGLTTTPSSPLDSTVKTPPITPPRLVGFAERQFYTPNNTHCKKTNNNNNNRRLLGSLQVRTDGGGWDRRLLPAVVVSASWCCSPTTTLFFASHTNATAPNHKNSNSSSSSSWGWIGGHWDRTFRLAATAAAATPSINNVNTNVTSHPNNDNTMANNNDANQQQQQRPYEGLDTMSRHTVNVKAGAWMPLSPLRTDGGRPRSSSGLLGLKDHHEYSNSNSPLWVSLAAAQGYAAVNMWGATAAVHAQLPSSSSSSLAVVPLEWQSYFSINLHDSDRPPLQLTLAHSNNTSNTNTIATTNATLALSQVIAFDRWQWNPWEDRAPMVRNTVAWTVRMDSSSATTPGSSSLVSRVEDSGTHMADDNLSSLPNDILRTNLLRMGAAWQVNRGLALKAVYYPQEQQLTTAIVLKRWQHPRIACSLLHSWNGWSSSRFLGVGIELETGSLNTNPDAYYYNHHPSRATLAVPHCEDVPQTRAVLPGEL